MKSVIGKGVVVLSLPVLVMGLAGCDQSSTTAREPDPVGGPPVMRRLTESQYRATVADIFGPETPVAARFERQLRVEGLIAIGTGEAGVSPFSIEQYDAAALAVADAVLSEARREQTVPCQPDSAEFDRACAMQFVEYYGTQLWRRPLAQRDIERFVAAAETGQQHLGNFYQGLKYALVGLMVAPEFLLRIEKAGEDGFEDGLAQLDAYSKASRLSYFLTNSTPDGELLRAASAGELGTQKGLAKQVDRLMASPRFEGAVRAFFADMLEFDLFEDLAKDPTIYPAYNSTVAADSQEQTLMTLVDHLLTGDGDYRDVFTTRETFLTRALGIVYRLPVPTRSGWERTEFPVDSDRRGIHTHASFLALHSHPGRSSPTLRGMALRDTFLCQEVPDPPADVDFSVVQNPSSTNMPTARDRLEKHRTEPSCAGCHKIMDPIGLTLENFDGVGSFRRYENEALIDISGSLDGVDFNHADGLAQALRNHPETPRCLVEKMYRFASGRDTVWEEREYMDYLIEAFAEQGYRVPALMRTIALSENFFTVRQEQYEQYHSAGIQHNAGEV